MFQTTVSEKIKTHILYSVTFSRKSCRWWDNVQKYGRARQATDDSLIQHTHFVCWMINPLPVQFKALLDGQKGCVFFSGHLNLRTTPETGLPSREKNHNN